MKDLSNENIIHIKNNGIEFLQFRKLLQFRDIITHAYTLGIDSNYRTAKANKEKLEENEFNNAVNNYKKISNAIGENYINIVKTNQEHTDNVQIIDGKVNKDFMDINLEKYDKTDGLITNKSNLLLSTTNADCILLFFFDPVTKTIANVHSGWKGTLQRISVKTVEKMKKEFGCKLEDIIVCMCPSIRKCHFEVEKDVKDMFEKEFQDIDISNAKEIMEKQANNEKWNIDTVLINRIILKEAGLRSENIIDSGICSVCEKDLVHSYRAEGANYGLETALIGLK